VISGRERGKERLFGSKRKELDSAAKKGRFRTSLPRKKKRKGCTKGGRIDDCEGGKEENLLSSWGEEEGKKKLRRPAVAVRRG